VNEYSYMKSSVPLVNTLAAMHIVAQQGMARWHWSWTKFNFGGSEAPVFAVRYVNTEQCHRNIVFSYNVAAQRWAATRSVWA